MDNLTARVAIEVDASQERVWEALTQPELVKQYFFNVDLITDWEEGSEILYKGEWEGVAFEEKGTVLEVDKPNRLVSNYWSPSSGLPDTLENRQIITYELKEQDGKTHLSVAQEGSKTVEAKEQSEANWKIVLDGLKKLVEKEPLV